MTHHTAHNGRALGKRPPVNKAALKMRDFVVAVPEHPIAADNTDAVTYGLDGNGQFGVCVPTGQDNLERTVTKRLTGKQRSMTQQQVFDDYRSQNPNFDPNTGADDNGMVIQDYLSWLVKQGRILGFAKVDVSNDEELTAAEYLFLATMWGVNLLTAQQQQTNSGLWDYRASGEWGGHCVIVPAYEANNEQDMITWAERVRTTASFRRHQLDECWVVLLQEHVDHPAFRKGFDLQKFGEAYTAITGRPFPVKPDPNPTPVPVPVPPGPSDTDREMVQVTKRMLARHTDVPGYFRRTATKWVAENE